MGQIRIGIVEDEMIISDVISLTVRKLGYEVAFAATNYATVIKMVNAEKPDLMLIDIYLGEDKDGIDVAKYIKETYSIPLIFLTANSDPATVHRAKEVKPNAYLVKPFSKDHLFAAIEIAIANHELSEAKVAKTIFVKDGYSFVKVFTTDIKYLNSDHNYVTLNMNNNKRIMVRSTLAEMHDKLDPIQFVKLNRGCVVNINYITKIDTDNVFIDQTAFAVGRAQRDMLIKQIEEK